MDRAERRGLARRSPVPGDRRALQVTLTDAGHRAAAAFHAEIGAELGRLISPLAPHDREHFRSTMAEILARCRTSRSLLDRLIGLTGRDPSWQPRSRRLLIRRCGLWMTRPVPTAGEKYTIAEIAGTSGVSAKPSTGTSSRLAAPLARQERGSAAPAGLSGTLLSRPAIRGPCRAAGGVLLSAFPGRAFRAGR